MVRIIFILAFLAAVRTSAAEDAQAPMTSESDSDTYYKFEWPIHRIAIIGAGPGYGRIAIEPISTIHLNLQWAHCLSGVLSGRLRCSCV